MTLNLKEVAEKHSLKINGILHIGASIGQEAEMYNNNIKNNIKVIWVEANPRIISKLKCNIKAYPNQKAVQALITNIDNMPMALRISNNSQSSSIYEFGTHKKHYPKIVYDSNVILRTTTLDTLCENEDMNDINTLVLDIQGAELLALKGCENNLYRFDYILTEVNMEETYIGCPDISKIDKYLKDYTRIETGEWHYNAWTDALYIKNEHNT